MDEIRNPAQTEQGISEESTNYEQGIRLLQDMGYSVLVVIFKVTRIELTYLVVMNKVPSST